MIFTETKLKGAYLVEIDKLKDDRGFYARSWCKKEMSEYGLNTDVVQINTSVSIQKGTLRGLHFQKKPYGETKMIRCVRGAVYDVIVDLRPESPTFKQWHGIELSQDNYKLLYVPENFAHGILSLTNDVEVIYWVTQFYTPAAEAGFIYNDPVIGIEWPIEIQVISEKDKKQPYFDLSLLT